MKNYKKILLASVLAIALLIGGVKVVKADVGGFWDQVADKTGYYLAQILGANEAVSEPVKFGGAGDTFSFAKISQKTGTTLVATTSLENTDSQPRIITKLYGFVSTTAGAPVTSLHFAFSTNTTGAGILVDLGVSTSIANAAATFSVSSTISPGNLASWNSSTYKYLICYTLLPVSSTVSFCGAEYAQY